MIELVSDVASSSLNIQTHVAAMVQKEVFIRTNSSIVLRVRRLAITDAKAYKKLVQEKWIQTTLSPDDLLFQ